MPPKPKHKPKHKKPPHPKHGTPHQKHTKQGKMVSSVIIGTGITAGFAIILYLMGIPTTVILPTSAPVWIGTMTLAYMAQNH